MKTYKTNLPQITLKLKKGEELNCQIKCSQDCADLMRKIWDCDSLPIYESVICIFLNRQNRTLGWYKVSQGGLTGSLIDVRLILSIALSCLATGIVIAHNHPSGGLQPSDADKDITKRLRDSANIMDISVIDHIILTETGHYSFSDENTL